MKRLLCLLVFLLGLPGVGYAAACLSLSATTLTDASCTSGAWDGGATCCPAAVPDPASTYTAAHVITVDGDLTFTTGGGLAQTTGGQYAFDTSGGRLTVELNDGDLDFAAAGSPPTFTLSLRTSNDTASVVTAPTDTDAVWTAGEIILCPGLASAGAGEWVEDCDANEAGQAGVDSQLMILWRETVVDVDASVLAVEIGDLVQLYWPTERGLDAIPMDDGFMYEIVLLADSDHNGDSYIILDVRSTEPANPDTGDDDWPENERSIVPIAAPADIVQGTRRGIDIGTTTYIDADMLRAGTCLYTRGVYLTDTPLGPVKVSRTEDDQDGGGAGTTDMIWVAPYDGLPETIASGADMFFAPICIQPGDHFLVIAPTEFNSNSASITDATVFFREGPVTVQGVLFDKLERVTVDVQGGETFRISHSWVRDSYGNGINGAIGAATAAQEYDAIATYFTITGGREAITCDGSASGGCHGWRMFNTSGTGDMTFSHFATRYLSDDNWFCGSGGICPNLVASYVNAGVMSDQASATTMNIFEVANTLGSTRLTDVACSQCGYSSFDGIVTCQGTPASCSIQRLGIVGTQFSSTPIPGYAFGATNLEVKDMVAVGTQNPQIFYDNASSILGLEDVNRCAMWDVWGSFGDLDRAANGQNTAGVSLKNCMIEYDACGGTDAFSMGVGAPDNYDTLFENISWWFREDPRAACTPAINLSSGAILYNTDATGSTDTFRRNTFSTEAGAARNVFRNSGSPVGETLTFDSNAFVHNYPVNQQTLNIGAELNAEANWVGTQCFFNNLSAPSGGTRQDYTSTFVQTVQELQDLELVGPGTGDFSPLPGGVAATLGCGIQGGGSAPGVRQDGWYLRVLGLGPTFQGVKGGGGATHGPVPF